VGRRSPEPGSAIEPLRAQRFPICARAVECGRCEADLGLRAEVGSEGDEIDEGSSSSQRAEVGV
jgi:hypothetical protein